MSKDNEWSKFYSPILEEEKNHVLEFQKEYRFLSSFTSCDITYEGISYPSVEHAYQMTKIADKEERARIIKHLNILELPSNKVKTLSKKFDVRIDWDDIKTGVMLDLVRLKFSNSTRTNSDLEFKLIQTSFVFPYYPAIKVDETLDSLLEKINDTNNFKIIIEGNLWRDKFWGVCIRTHKGFNHLGKIIMQVRNEKLMSIISNHVSYSSQSKIKLTDYPVWQDWIYTSYSGVKGSHE